MLNVQSIADANETDIAQFTATKAERRIIAKIGLRAAQVMKIGAPLHWEMNVEAVHCNGCPLRLVELAKSDDFNFIHDMAGIERHLDKGTGRLTGFFLPRFSRGAR